MRIIRQYRKSDFTLILIYVINITILFYLFRTAIPFFKYPFIILYTSLIIYTIFHYRNRLVITMKGFIRDYIFALILVLFLFTSLLLSNKIYLLVIKDILNAIILISLFLILYFIVSTKYVLLVLTGNLIKLILFFAVIVSLERLSISLNISPFSNVLIPEFSVDNIAGIDYNFALIPVFLGIVIIFFFLKNAQSGKNLILYNLIFIIFTLNIFFSGSRR